MSEKPFGIVVSGEAQIVEAFVDAVAARKQFGMGFARMNDGLDLRIRKNAVLDETFRSGGR